MKLTIFIWGCMALFTGQLICKGVTIKVKYIEDSPTKGIQEAADMLHAKGGGKLIIPSGRYVIRQPVFVYDNMLISGEGSKTIIQSDAEYESPLAQDAKKGTDYIVVKDPARFRVNDAICVTSRKAKTGYSAAFGVITKINGNKIYLELCKYSKFRRDYPVSLQARAVHTHCIFRTFTKKFRNHGKNGVDNLTIRDLTVLGSAKPLKYTNWFANSGLFLGGTNITLENLAISNVAGDGITIGGHMKGRYLIRGNRISHTGYRAIHFGDNAQEIIVTNNIINDTGNDGIYFCWGCQRVIVSNNLITKTKLSGIGGVGGGGNMDRYDIIASNVIQDCGKHGIEFKRQKLDKTRCGKFISINANVIKNTKEAGLYLYDAECINFTGNTITRCAAGVDIRNCAGCLIANNLIVDTGVAVIISAESKFRKPDEFTENNYIHGNSFLKNKKNIVNSVKDKENIIKNNLTK
jgi:parallel beta-helix repeat protein